MVVEYIIFCCLKQSHVRKHPDSQSCDYKVDLAKCQAGRLPVSTHSNTQVCTSQQHDIVQ